MPIRSLFLAIPFAFLPGSFFDWKPCSNLSLFALASQSKSPKEIYEYAISFVFTIVTPDGLGTGFAYPRGFISTAAHVVGTHNEVEIVDQIGSRFTARVIARNSDLDFAVLELVGISPLSVTLGLQERLDPLSIGEPIA
jgi:S1-C subfamily serine protease